jgi:integrase
VARHLTPDLASATVASLKRDDLSSWRAGLIAKGLRAATADRIARVCKAALALAAVDDARITNTTAWRTGLKKLKGANKPKEPKFLDRDVVCALVAAAHQVSLPFGLLIDVMAQSGSRFSQLVRLTVADLIDTPPTLLIPSSKKGGKDPRQEHVPISAPLAAALRGTAAADGRAGTAPLLVDSNGAPWRREVDPQAWREIIERVGLDDSTTSYALRHSSIQRQLLASVPIILVAKTHDTSCTEIEKTYARTIARIKGAGDKVRAALLDTTPPAGANVIPLRRG